MYAMFVSVASKEPLCSAPLERLVVLAGDKGCLGTIHLPVLCLPEAGEA